MGPAAISRKRQGSPIRGTRPRKFPRRLIKPAANDATAISSRNQERPDHLIYPVGSYPASARMGEFDDSIDTDAIINQIAMKIRLDLVSKTEGKGNATHEVSSVNLETDTLDLCYMHIDEDNAYDQLIPAKIAKSWGIIPFPKLLENNGDQIPQFDHQGQPAARTSNAATVPALWEDPGFQFKEGRYQIDANGNQYDQQEFVFIRLMDMRPVSDIDHSPRCLPCLYECKGIPLDWANKRLIKAMNDRRQVARERAAHAPRWCPKERLYLASLLQDHPNASILELAERFNYRFKGDVCEDSFFPAVEFSSLHPGRTVEDVKAEYLAHKEKYDGGMVGNHSYRRSVDKDPTKAKYHAKLAEFMERFGDNKKDEGMAIQEKPHSVDERMYHGALDLLVLAGIVVRDEKALSTEA